MGGREDLNSIPYTLDGDSQPVTPAASLCNSTYMQILTDTHTYTNLKNKQASQQNIGHGKSSYFKIKENERIKLVLGEEEFENNDILIRLKQFI